MILGLLGLRPWNVIYGYWFEWIQGGRILKIQRYMFNLFFLYNRMLTR